MEIKFGYKGIRQVKSLKTPGLYHRHCKDFIHC